MAHRVNFDSRRTLLLLAALGGVSAVASFSVDQSCSQSLRSLELPGDLGKAIQLSEVFAHGIGVAAILGTLLLVAKHQRSAVLGTILITAAAGLTANLAKQTVVRIRPNSQGKIQVERKSLTTNLGEQVSLPADVAVVEPSFWDSRQRSFPSGHAATAWGLAIGLSLAFPRGVWLFLLFASLASLQRIVSGAHFPSDVFAGAAISFVTASLLLSLRQVRTLFLLDNTP